MYNVAFACTYPILVCSSTLVECEHENYTYRSVVRKCSFIAYHPCCMVQYTFPNQYSWSRSALGHLCVHMYNILCIILCVCVFVCYWSG